MPCNQRLRIACAERPGSALEQYVPIISTAKRLILVAEPFQCMLEMCGFEVRPVGVDYIKIRINRLQRQEAAQSAAAAPSHDEIEPGYILRSQLAVLQSVNVPLPAVVHQKIYLDAVSLPNTIGRQLIGKFLRSVVAEHQ